MARRNQPTKSPSQPAVPDKYIDSYIWQPQWQYLDDYDLTFFFCLLSFTITDQEYNARDFPPRLKRLFENRQSELQGKKHSIWIWAGTPDMLEVDDIVYLTQFLHIVAPREIVELPNFYSRLLIHLERDHEGNYKWKPQIDMLDLNEIPHIVRFFKFSIDQDTFNAPNFAPQLRPHFKAVKLLPKKSENMLKRSFDKASGDCIEFKSAQVVGDYLEVTGFSKALGEFHMVKLVLGQRNKWDDVGAMAGVAIKEWEDEEAVKHMSREDDGTMQDMYQPWN